MAKCKQNINKHLNSAQQWLSEAEQAFDKDSDIRGELNLFLAQAEITRAQETQRPQYWRQRYPVLRHGLAISLAVIIAAGGMTASYLWGISRHSTLRPLTIEQPVPVAANNSSQTGTISGSTIPTAEHSSPAATPEANASQTVAGQEQAIASQQVSSPAAASAKRAPAEARQSAELPLKPDEIDKLIRLAGKSLRGQ
ncbi:hypothetical protein [Sporomusa aerivorans]|uniref:hypothetical protein n=1 Tax=Sporomusa aerivorans TaxID=204936 RepID=UPI00352B81D8